MQLSDCLCSILQISKFFPGRGARQGEEGENQQEAEEGQEEGEQEGQEEEGQGPHAGQDPGVPLRGARPQRHHQELPQDQPRLLPGGRQLRGSHPEETGQRSESWRGGHTPSPHRILHTSHE